MTNNGDDCYFFYYSTCSKGDSCPFRHCEAAMGNETVCNLWQEGRCFRSICKFRHMEITKNRKEIPCYWENQPAGCQKPHCAFFHEKARYIDGIFVPGDKSLIKSEEQPTEEPAPPPTATLTTAANPQLRGVIKTESQEPVPSPTHPPVVINPADDDEDEDDQFSEEGDDGKCGHSPRKQPKSGDSLNFGVSTLEEIRLRKALKASMKRAGYPIQSSDLMANGEKENLQSFFRPTLYDSREAHEETRRSRGSMAERLGSGEGVLLKRSLADRLGRVVDEEDPLMLQNKALKPVKDRLGLSSALDATDAVESNMEPKRASKQIRIKTLEEIKREKAAKSQNQTSGSSIVCPESTKIIATKATKGIERAVTVKDDSISRVKTFSEILQAKRKREEEQQENGSMKKGKHTVESVPGKNQDKSDTAGPGPESTNTVEVRVKTLEEIRREKATRIQAQKATEIVNKTSRDSEENGVKKPHLMRINKPASNSSDATEKRAEVPEKPLRSDAHRTSPVGSKNVIVKTFEEIMREKRLRKQEMGEQKKVSTETSLKQTNDGSLKRKFGCLTPPGSLSPSSATQTPDNTPSNPKLPVRKLIPLKTKDASPLTSTTSPGTTVTAVAVVTSVPVKQSCSPQEQDFCSQSPISSREVPDKNIRNSAVLSPSKQTATADNLRKSPEHTVDTKVRPKLNVRPSVVKPAVQVKPGQKRRGTERSAVAAVKPLNSSCTELEEPLQETSSDGQVFPSSSTEAQLSSDVPRSPSALLDSTSSSSPLREELQTVPVFSQNTSQETKSTFSASSSREACAVPQSLVQKTPSQPKAARRQSTSVSRTLSTSALSSSSAMDDFEQLMNEFTDDHLEEEVDPGIGEDDLLQELSEMIDS